MPIQANAYLTPPHANAFDLHFDTHDVFIWQQDGSKRWKVFGCKLENPRHEQRFDLDSAGRDRILAQGPLIDTDLARGDVLYIPRGFLHSGSCTGAPSLHLTIGLHSDGPLEEVITALDRLQGKSSQAQWRSHSLASFADGYDDAVRRRLIDDITAVMASGEKR